MDSETRLRRLASVVQTKLDELYRAPNAALAGSALDQAGLRNGFEIVSDYVDHREQGVAFEHLLYMITEPGLVLDTAEFRDLVSIGRSLGFAETRWERIRQT